MEGPGGRRLAMSPALSMAPETMINRYHVMLIKPAFRLLPVVDFKRNSFDDSFFNFSVTHLGCYSPALWRKENPLESLW
jgi:hypothetical protein